MASRSRLVVKIKITTNITLQEKLNNKVNSRVTCSYACRCLKASSVKKKLFGMDDTPRAYIWLVYI